MKKSELREMVREEIKKLHELSGAEVAKRMEKIGVMKSFAPKVAKMKTVSRKTLEDLLPDYIPGKDLAAVLKEGMREDMAAQRNMMRDYEATRTRRRYPVTEAVALKKGAKVKDVMGNTYTVIEFSKMWPSVAKYDDTGAGLEAYKMFGSSRDYVAVKDNKGKTFVFTHGDDGVE